MTMNTNSAIKNQLFLFFSDKILEQKFLEKQMVRNLGYNRFIFIIAIILITIFNIFRHLDHPEEFYLYEIIPFTVGLIMLIMTVILSLKVTSYRLFNTFMAMAVLTNQLAIVISAAFTPQGNFYYVFTGIFISIIGGFTLVRIRFIHACILCIIIAVVTLTFFLPNQINNAGDYLRQSFLLAIAAFIGLATNFKMEKEERHNFLKLEIIVDDRVELSKMR